MTMVLESFARSAALNFWMNAFGDVLLKTLVILAAANLLHRSWRTASAAARHLLWALVLAGIAALPVLTLALPEWRVAPMPLLPAPHPAALAEKAEIPTSPAVARNVTRILPGPSSSMGGAQVVTQDIRREPPSQAGWPVVLFATWCGGALLVCGRMLVRRERARRMVSRAGNIEAFPWEDTVCGVVSQLNLRRNVRVLFSGEISVPLAWGTWRTAVLLPSDARNWSPERRRIVLLHELEHVRRRDCLTQLMAHVACAIYWFNPLVWRAARQLRLAREMACDDMVLAAGTRASLYAKHIVDLARGINAVGCASPAAVGLTCSQLETRVRAILDPGARRRKLRRTTIAAAILVAACKIVPLSALSPKTNGTGRTEPRPESFSEPAGGGRAPATGIPRQAMDSESASPAAMVLLEKHTRPGSGSSAQDSAEIQTRLDQLQKAFKQLSRSVDLYHVGRMREAELEDASRELDERIAAFNKVIDPRVLKALASLRARKSELHQKLVPLNLGDSNSWRLMQQRGDAERETIACAQLLWRQFALEKEIKVLLSRSTGIDTEVRQKRTELESVKSELEKLINKQ